MTPPALRKVRLSRLAAMVCLLLAAGLPAGCRTTSAPYSLAQARELNRLKTRSLRVMEQAEEPFQDHEKDVRKLQGELERAMTTAGDRAGNEISLGQWKLLLRPDGHLLGGFLARWERDTRLDPTFIVEASAQVRTAFETMARHEREKTGGPG